MKYILQGIFKILNKEEKAGFVKLIIFDVFISFLDIAFLGILLLIINFYTQHTASNKAFFIYNDLADRNSVLPIGAFLFFFGIKNFFAYQAVKSQHHFFYKVATRLSTRNINDYFDTDYKNYLNINSAVETRRISQQPVEFSHYMLTNLQQALSQLVLILFTVCALFLYHPTIFFLLFLLLLPPVMLLGWYIKKKLKTIRGNIKVTGEKAIQHLNESLNSYIESNIYRKNIFFGTRYSGYQQQLNENIASQQSLQSLPSRLIEFFAVLGFFILVVINKWSANAPAIDLLTISIFMVAAYKVIPGIVKILNCAGQMKTYTFTVTDLLPSGRAEKSRKNNSSEAIKSIEFNRVSFEFKDYAVLTNTSFNLSPGDFAGITGRSGKGKTTVINLLLGNLSPDNGFILINNKTTSVGERQIYWDRISYVKQQPFLIDDSIIKNITLNDLEYDKTKLNEVISFCGIDTFLKHYPEGLEKSVKENGKNLSGGQRQRIMLARALYHDFDLLILDEPFSELDEPSEHCLLKKLQHLTRQGKIILFITHNKSSLTYCNKIIDLNGN